MGNQNLSLLPSAARSASGSQTTPLDVSQMSELAVFLVVGTASGASPSLTVTIEDSPDGSNWANAYSFPAVTTASAVLRAGWQDLKMSVGRFLRVSWQISGSGASFTFSVQVVPVSSN